jgi:cellobiose-specific phosphotransferase system component IIA
MSLDADSIDYLDDVKKGKPRRFVMICKGVQIKSLVVYKKGSVERYKKQAKEEGTGQFYHGVIDGKGVDIAFKLCRSDGYEKPPGKELILKDYLNTQAGMRFKPVYEIVDTLPDVDERDEAPPDVPPIPEAGTYTTEDLAAECKRLKAALYPQVKPAVAAHPDQKDAITRLLVLADKNEKATEFASAIESYQELSALLASLPEAEQEEEEGETTENPAVVFNERLKALLSDLKAAAGTPAGDEAKRIMSEAGGWAKKKDFVQGNALLEKAHEILNDWAAENLVDDPAELFNERLKALISDVKAAAGTPAGDEAKRIMSEAGALAKKKDFVQGNALLEKAHEILNDWAAENLVDDPAELFNERLRTLLPDVKAAAGTLAGDEAKRMVGEAGNFAREKDFAEANSLLDEAEDILKMHGGEAAVEKAGAPTDLSDIAPGIVKKRKFLIERWKQIPEEVSTDLQSLRQAIERDIPDEDADLLIELSQDYLTDFCDDMKESIDDDINSGDAQYKNAISTIQSFRAKIGSDPLILHLKKNTLKAAVTVDSILLNVLAEVEQALAS